jgi:hypothetical protein
MTYQTTAIAAIVALVLIMAALIFGLGVSGRLDANSTPLIVTVFGMIATVVASLTAVLRADRVSEKVDLLETKAEAIERAVNGPPPPSPHP